MKIFSLLFVSLACCLTISASAIEIVAHRGANHLAPENTRAAAQACIDLNIDYVEIDVRMSRDGVFYIMHDREVDRTTNGSGILGKMDSSALDALDAGSWFSPEFKGERIPRLKEYLQWLNGKAKVYFDVKAGSMKQLVALVRETGFENDSFFWFGNKLLLGSFLKYGKDLKLKINAYTPEEVEDAANRYKASIVEMPLAALTPACIQSCRKHAIRIMIYEKENTDAVFRQILDSDADLVNLDKPELFVKVRDNAEKAVN